MLLSVSGVLWRLCVGVGVIVSPTVVKSVPRIIDPRVAVHAPLFPGADSFCLIPPKKFRSGSALGKRGAVPLYSALFPCLECRRGATLHALRSHLGRAASQSPTRAAHMGLQQDTEVFFLPNFSKKIWRGSDGIGGGGSPHAAIAGRCLTCRAECLSGIPKGKRTRIAPFFLFHLFYLIFWGILAAEISLSPAAKG